MAHSNGRPPVLLLSHGTTLLTGEQSHIRDYWQQHGEKALTYGIKGVIIMGPIGVFPAEKKSDYDTYRPNPDIETATRCIEILRNAGFDAVADTDFDWRIDTFPMLLRMFPSGCPPVTIISQNTYFEPHFHVEMGRMLRPLRKEGYLFIGSGGGVHNLYRADWMYNWRYRDNFAQAAPPDGTHLEFRQALEDVICKNGGGPALKRGVVRLMKHPNYRDAHGTDDHYMPTCFIAGIVGEEEDRGEKAVLGAELWELKSRRNSILHRRLAIFRKVDIASKVILAAANNLDLKSPRVTPEYLNRM